MELNELYKQATNDYRGGSYEEAAKKFKLVLENHPNSEEASYAKAYIENIRSVKDKSTSDIIERRSNKLGWLAVSMPFIGVFVWGCLYIPHLREPSLGLGFIGVYLVAFFILSFASVLGLLISIVAILTTGSNFASLAGFFLNLSILIPVCGMLLVAMTK